MPSWDRSRGGGDNDRIRQPRPEVAPYPQASETMARSRAYRDSLAAQDKGTDRPAAPEKAEQADTRLDRGPKAADRDAEKVSRLEATIKRFEKVFQRQDDLIETQTKQIGRLNSDLDEHDKTIEKLEEKNEKLEARTSRQASEIDRLKAELAKKAGNPAGSTHAIQRDRGTGTPPDASGTMPTDTGGTREPADAVRVSDNDEGTKLGKLDFPSGQRPGSSDIQGRPLDRPDGTRIPLFDGDPARDQIQQGRLGDCGVITALGAVAGHTPHAIRDRIRETGDGNYEVRLHEAAYDSQSHHWKPTGRDITLTVTPDLPVSSRRPDQPGFAGSGDAGVAWPSIMEKALAGVDRTWTGERRADWDNRWPRQCELEGREVTPVPKGYERLHQGTVPGDQAEILTQLTGRPAMTRALPSGHKVDDTTISGDVLLTERFRGLLQSDRPVLVGTRPLNEDEIQLPHKLNPGHAYEVIQVDDENKLHLRNPWGRLHPEPMTALQFRENMASSYTTLEKN